MKLFWNTRFFSFCHHFCCKFVKKVNVDTFLLIRKLKLYFGENDKTERNNYKLNFYLQQITYGSNVIYNSAEIIQPPLYLWNPWSIFEPVYRRRWKQLSQRRNDLTKQIYLLQDKKEEEKENLETGMKHLSLQSKTISDIQCYPQRMIF